MNHIKCTLKNLEQYAPVVVRIGMALVFLWFALNQFFNPKIWVGYLPEFLASTSNPVLFIYLNAVFETILGIMLLLGIFTRLSALLLGLHLVIISISLGYSATAIRDWGLSIATLSIALHGHDNFCLMKNSKL
jgi:uncharacterized membrane protein YphA (DoxX/SURF4 family)